ncbi:CbiQ family ECF transporter T component [Microbacterium sp. RD1]|uniref:CbiQ family ECF transporter T component n=1 Tax=Microbacterium sp. RD1 TaxID=3457313 RepID=UPI003FA54291
MISLYRPGTSPLHRLPAGPKVLLLATIVLAIGLAGKTWPAVAVCLVVVVALFALAGHGARVLARQVFALRWVLVATFIPQVIFLPLETAAINTCRVLLAVLACALLSMTTRVPDLLATTERALGPLRRFGVDPTRIGFVLTLTITTIPTIVQLAHGIRDAQRARGITPWPHRFVMPLLIASMRHADQLGEALVARGAT